MKIYKYNLSDGELVIKSYNEVKEWYFILYKKSRIRNNQLLLLRIDGGKELFEGTAYFSTIENKFIGSGIFEKV